METQDHDQVVDEIRQLCRQYATEVPSRRRTWPRSIRDRVLQLLQLELSCEEVASLTGIPAPTVYSWKPKVSEEPCFLPVQVVAEKALPVRKEPVKRRERKKATSTIIVIAPNGTRFEGLDVKSALAVAREMGSWN